MRWIAKLLGALALLVGLGTLGLMLAARLEGAPVNQALGQVWASVDRSSLGLLQVAIERHLWAPLWDWAVFPVLRQSAPVVLGVALLLGIGLLLLGRRRGDGGVIRRQRMFKR